MTCLTWERPGWTDAIERETAYHSHIEQEKILLQFRLERFQGDRLVYIPVQTGNELEVYRT